jgi:exodeoxyribonuclease VIII
MKDGIYPDMTREQYDAQADRENWSRTKNIGRSPAHYIHAMLEPRADKAAYRNGRANHTAVLEPEKFASTVAVWDGGRRASKAWDAFSEANADRDILTQAEYEQLLGMQRAVRQHPIASKYLQRGRAEVSILWTCADPLMPGLVTPCKSRLDYLAPDWIVDLKTCRDASPAAFSRAAFNFEYHAQAAFYVDAVAAVTGKRLPYIIVAAELAPPCVVQVYRLPEHVLAAGRERYRTLLARLAVCRREDRWGGYAEDEIDLELPRWSGIEAPEPEGESLEDLGLSIAGEAHGL